MSFTIEDAIEFLHHYNISVTTAESCTAGLVAAFMADVTGCGTALHSGYIVYTEEAKNSCLDVSRQTIQKFGLTSEEVAKEMVIGALKKSSAQLGIAVTGMAESDGSLDGVICFAYGLKSTAGYRLMSETKKFEGQRNTVRTAAAVHALVSIPVVYKKIQLYPEILS